MLKPPPAIPGRGARAEANADKAEAPKKKNYQHETTGFSGMTARYGTGKHKDESFHEGHLKTISDIAKKHLDLDTLETRRSDDHDFSNQGVWGIHDALKAAFQAGRKAK